jgi:hypothetical protein
MSKIQQWCFAISSVNLRVFKNTQVSAYLFSVRAEIADSESAKFGERTSPRNLDLFNYNIQCIATAAYNFSADKSNCKSTCGRANGLYPILIALAGAHFPGRTAKC